jgi:dihydrofolate synthase/folylpolyglutamate synthase
MIQSLATARLPGRFEVVGSSPAVVLDGAHNPESVRALVKTVVQYLRFDALVVVFGVAADKHFEPMLRALAGVADKVVFTRAAGNKRSADPAALQKRYRALGGRLSFVAPTVREALEVARKGCGSGDAVCVTGSFYVVGEARAILGERRGQVRRP